MSENKSEWYVRGEDGKVFGPVDMATLVGWAKESRIEPSFMISRDRANWTGVPLVPELGMTWLVETQPGTFYGPFNRAVVDSLVAAGTVPKDVRLYSLDDGRAAAERAKIEAELKAKDEALTALEERAAKQAETTKKTISFMEAKLAELTGAQQTAGESAAAELKAAKEEIYAGRERMEKAELALAEKEAELAAAKKKLSAAENEAADLKTQLDAVTKFTKAPVRKETVEAEVIISDVPPPKSAPHFTGVGSSAGLAALEAAAARELAAAKRKGMGIGGIFGGRK